MHLSGDYPVEHTGQLHFGLQWSIQYQLMFHYPTCAFVVIDQHCGGWCRSVGMPGVVYWQICFWWGVLRWCCSCMHDRSLHIWTNDWIVLKIFQFDWFRWLKWWLRWQNMFSLELVVCWLVCISLTLFLAAFGSSVLFLWHFHFMWCAVLHSDMLSQGILRGIPF